MARKKRGRPKGSTKKKTDNETVEATPSRCRACGSTNREAYTTKATQTFAGRVPGTGEPFTHITRRRVACADCGQHRIDRTHENRPG
jgi:hypothetical protein